MGFIKRGDGQILSVIDTEDMTEEQKKLAKEMSKKVKTTDNTDSSDEKKSGR